FVLFASPLLSSAQSGGLIYTVRAGDTLTSIANHFGVAVGAIITANHLKDPNAIMVGMQLVIPIASKGASGQSSAQSTQSAPGTYVVQRGDTLIGISNKVGVSVEQLMAANKITDPSMIRVGQVLTIPNDTFTASVSLVSSMPDGHYNLSPKQGGP